MVRWVPGTKPGMTSEDKAVLCHHPNCCVIPAPHVQQHMRKWAGTQTRNHELCTATELRIINASKTEAAFAETYATASSTAPMRSVISAMSLSLAISGGATISVSPVTRT